MVGTKDDAHIEEIVFAQALHDPLGQGGHGVVHLQFPALDLQKDSHPVLFAPGDGLVQGIDLECRLQLCYGIVPDLPRKGRALAHVQVVVDHHLVIGGKLHINLNVVDAAAQHVLRIVQEQLRLAAAEQLGEVLTELLVDQCELLL